LGDPRPIGLFDSGVGGLSVAQEILRLFPDESIIYFGDTAHVPYGPRHKEELVKFAQEIISFLISCDAKYVVFACGTNSSLTLPVVCKLYAIPMIGLVGPGAREAVRSTINGRIGVIATEATVKSGAYQNAIKVLSPDATVFARFAPRLVPLVEAGLSKSSQAREAVLEYAQPLKEALIDTLILGCTHYPFLTSYFAEYFGPQVKLINPAKATVLAAGQEMGRLNRLSRTGRTVQHRYYVSGNPEEFLKTARQLGYNLSLVHQLRLEDSGCAYVRSFEKEECSEVV